MFAPKNILVPTDFSKHSDTALKEAIEIAKQYGAQIHILHVVTKYIQQQAIDYSINPEMINQLEKESVDGAEEKLKKEVAEIVKEQNVRISFGIQIGNPWEIILSEQKAKNIDLIVIASHGKTGILEYFMGNVAEKVIKGAKCPVLVIKP